MTDIIATVRSTVPTLPREIARGTFWFGCCLEVHQPNKIVHNHNSSYLLIGSKSTVLVDTGMPYGWLNLKAELMKVLDGRPLDYIFPTHPEAPHMGNIGPLMEIYPEMRIAGDIRNYHLYYPGCEDKFISLHPGDSIDLGGRCLMALPAIIHDIPNSLWAYEPDQKILFVSDAYPYTHEHEVGECGLTSEELPYRVRPEDTSTVIGFALSWARHVDAEKVIDPLRALLKQYPVNMIAPAHGGVITNPEELTDIFEKGLRKVRIRCMSRAEKIADGVICLNDVRPIDGRVSWLPPLATGFESYNENLVVSDTRVLMIETGVACHGPSLVESLADIMGGRRLVIFPTRIELDSIGNLARLIRAFDGTELVSANPIPANRLVHRPDGTTPIIPFTPVTPGQTLADVGFPNIRVIDPVIRTLGTAWLFDEDSHTLFTGDFFCDDLLATPETPTLRHNGAPLFAPEGLRRSVLQKFDWLENASTTNLQRAWDDLFGRIKPQAIAGVRGRVCCGYTNVQSLLALYRQALFCE